MKKKNDCNDEITRRGIMFLVGLFIFGGATLGTVKVSTSDTQVLRDSVLKMEIQLPIIKDGVETLERNLDNFKLNASKKIEHLTNQYNSLDKKLDLLIQYEELKREQEESKPKPNKKKSK